MLRTRLRTRNRSGFGASFILAAPVLTWDDEADDSTPDFTVDFDENTAADDVVRYNLASDSAFATILQNLTDTLDAGEISAGEIALAGSELEDGTYYARVRVERNGNPASPWSNTEDVVIVGGGFSGFTPTYYFLGF